MRDVLKSSQQHQKGNGLFSLFNGIQCFDLFVLWHINLTSNLMPNQVKENKSEKKFKGEILEINDKL